MAAIKKLYDITLDLKRQSNIELKGLVAGDNGTVFRIELTDGGDSIQDVDINACRIIMKVRSSLGWRSQDSLITDNDVTISNGIITIALHPESFASGKNLVQLSVYSSASASWDTLVTTQYFSFDAQASVDEAETIRTSQTYPALIDAINRCNAAAGNVVGIQSVSVNDNSHLIIRYTNGNTVDAGALNAIGSEGQHIIMTNDSGVLYAGNRLIIGDETPSAADYQEGDIYLKQVGGFDAVTAQATSLPSGSAATASYNESTGVLSLGIPRGANGANGSNGQDGYTPVRGTDYWTASDVATIQSYVDEHIPTKVQDLNVVVGNTDPEAVSVPSGTIYLYVEDL